MSAHRLHYWGLKALSVWGVILAAFLLPHLLPGSPLPLYETWSREPAQRAGLIAAYGFDRPLPVQYIIWMRRLAIGRWGYSRFYHRPVFRDTLRAIGFTSLLLLWTVVAYGLWRIALEGVHRILRSLSPGTSLTRGKQLAILDALPKFLVAIIMHDVAVWRLGWTSFTNVALFVPYHYLNPLIMLLPASALALTPLVVWHARGHPAPIFQESSKWKQLRQHGRHLCPLVRPLLGYFLMEVLITEHVFALPGLGSFGIDALRRHDFPTVQGFILGIGALYILIAFILDLGSDDRRHNSTFGPGNAPSAALPRRSRQAVYSSAWSIMILIALAMWAPRLWLYDPMEIHTHDQLLLPNSRYILGTDFLGRDVLSRTVGGFRSSMSRIALSMALIGMASGLFLGLKRILPVSLRPVWNSTLALFDALPPFLLALLALLVVEHRSWPLEIALTIACLPPACKMAMGKSSLFHRVATLAYLAELMLLLDVSFFYLNLTPEPPTPTWGGDLRIGMNYSHLNIWLLLAPALAVTWSRYTFHRLGVHSPLVGVVMPPRAAL